MIWDAVSFLRAYGIPASADDKHVSPEWIGVRCPFCDDGGFHGGFHLARGYYNCWRCGGHDVLKAVRALLGVSTKDAESAMHPYVGRVSLLARLNRAEESPRPTEVEMPGEPLRSFHRRYLRQRGFVPSEIVNRYGVQGTGPSGPYRLRLMIPVYFRGRLVSYIGRDVTEKQDPKYKACPLAEAAVNHKTVLYDIDSCWSARSRVAVVEGTFDAWRIGEGAVATFGTAVKEQQIKLLSHFTEVFFVFDPEPAAQQLARKAAAKLSAMGKHVEVIDLEGSTDPGSLPPEEVKHLRRELRL